MCILHITDNFTENINYILDNLNTVEAHHDNKKDFLCADGFKSYSSLPSNCYMVVAQYGVTWENANQFCNLKESSLIMPQTQEQNHKIKEIIQKNILTIEFWRGFEKNRKFRVDDFRIWNDGIDVSFNSWQDWNTLKTSKHDCVMLSQTRKSNRFALIDKRCINEYMIIPFTRFLE